MKKILSFIIIAVMLFSFTSCGKKDKSKTPSDTSSVSPAETEIIEDPQSTTEATSSEQSVAKDTASDKKSAQTQSASDNKKNGSNAKTDNCSVAENTGSKQEVVTPPSLPGTKDKPIELDEIPD